MKGLLPAYRRKEVKLDSNDVNLPCGQSYAVVLVSKGLDMKGWFLISPAEKADAWFGDVRVGSCLSRLKAHFAVARRGWPSTALLCLCT